MASFHEVRFPMRLALATTGGPYRRTDIVSLSNGRENRNSRWRDARRRYDAGSCIRSITDLYEVLAFFEARCGQLYGFRFTDPLDHQSCGPLGTPDASDQPLGTGDGATRDFQLAKTYADDGGATRRVIAKPEAGSVVLRVDGGDVAPDAFSLDATTGLVTFSPDSIPANGAVITAGFRFDVPVRFDMDTLDINLSAFNAGRIPTIPLIEIAP